MESLQVKSDFNFMFAYKQVILILLRLLMEMGEQKVVTSYMLHML